MRKKEQNYMEVSRALIRELEALNNVQFGKQSCDIVFQHIKDRDDNWIAEIERLEKQNAELVKLSETQQEAMINLRNQLYLAQFKSGEK